MSKKWVEIKDIFDSVNDNQMPENLIVPWNASENKIRKINFLKFSFFSFNIYIVTMLFAFGLTAGITSYNYLQTKKELEILKQKIPESQTQVNEEIKPVISVTDSISQKTEPCTLTNRPKKKILPFVENVPDTVVNVKVIPVEVIIRKPETPN